MQKWSQNFILNASKLMGQLKMAKNKGNYRI